jgi:hypothetical protein
MTNPNLIEIAEQLADYIVKKHYEHEIRLYPDSFTFKDENGNIRYKPETQDVYNKHYDYVYNLLDSASLRVKDELETIHDR